MSATNIPEFLQNPFISGIVRTADVPKQYIMSQWFPQEPVDADEFEGLVQLDESLLAPFVAIDAETPRMPDDMISSYKWSVAYIRYKKAFKESDLRIFFEPGITDPNHLTARMANAAERKIRRYVDALSQSIDARLEWIATQAIQGSVAYDDGHVVFSVSYPGTFIGSTNRKSPTTLWTGTSPTIVTDLSNWVEGISELTGHDQWTLVLPQRVLGVMARNEDIRELWAAAALNPAATAPGSLAPVGQIGTEMVAGALRLLGINQVIRYNAKYTTRTEAYGSATRTKTSFLETGDIFLLPTGVPLGRMAVAPAKANNYQPGKFGWSTERTDPWVVEVGAGLFGWIDWPPTKLDWVLQARVL